MWTHGYVKSMALGLALLTTLGEAPIASAQTCSTTTVSFSESFDDTVFRDPSTSAAGWGQGALRLALKGNSFNTSDQNVGERIFVVAAGDYDNDGWVDMAAIMLAPDRLHFLKNMGIDGLGNHRGFSAGGARNTAPWTAQIIDSAIPDFDTNAPAILSGDFDGDGDTDLLYLKTATQNNAGSVIRAFIYRLDGVSSGLPVFTRIEVTSHFQTNRVSWHWTSNFAQIVDWNKDGRADLVASSSFGTTNEILLFRATTTGIGFQAPVRLVANVGFTPPFADAGATNTATGGSSCAPSVLLNSRGGSGIAVNDFDGDGDLDIIAGSLSERDLKFWKNDGADVFTRQPDITFSFGGVTFILTGDLDSDGDQDLVVGRDGWNCGGNGGNAYFFANSGSGAFVMRAAPILSTGADVDFGAAFFIDENIRFPNLNLSPDRTIDIIAADGNDSGTYSQVLGRRLSVYNLGGLATSTVIDALDNVNNAIVEVTMSGVDQTISPPATGVTYWVSNDGGSNWEKLQPSEVATSGSPGATHTFSHFGSDFRWRAELAASEVALAGDDAAFAPGSKSTPEIRSISWSYGYVLRREYSRSALTFAEDVPISSTVTKDLLISSTFFYPGYEGTLRAFDPAFDLQATTEPNNDLNRRVIKSGTGNAVVWDAAEQLRVRPGSSRIVYTALPDGSGVVNQRTGFVSANASVLSTPMATDLATTTAVIDFIRDGMGHVTGNKLWDVGHSSPVYLGPPKTSVTDRSLTDDGYATFAAAQQSRAKTVFIGTNSGMVHAFDAQTGAERWAFIPYNLLAKLKLQRAVSADGDVFFNHQNLVDGSVVVRDVFDRAAGRWRTLLIAGQALGTGRGDNNYYFALDVTDPTNPLPLWEFTDDWLARDKSCTGQFSRQNCVTVTPPPVCTASCTADNHRFVDSGADRIAFEAEDFNLSASLGGVHNWVVGSSSVAQPGFYGAGYIVSTPDSGTNCTSFATCGATVNYQIQADAAGDYRVYIRYRATASSMDSLRFRVGPLSENLTSLSTGTSWRWVASTNTVTLPVGDQNFELFMRKDGIAVDKILLVRNGAAGGAPTTSDPTPVCANLCVSQNPVTTCSTQTFDPAAESFECGAGTNLKCCQDPSSQWYCSPVGQSCEDLDTVLGQTWSPPVLAPLKLGGSRSWMVVFGSGYNNRLGVPAAVGRSVYAIDAITGTRRAQWDYNDVPQSNPSNPSTIDNTIPGGVAVYDFTTNGNDELPDGYADVIYVGDLEGRLWKIDVHDSATVGPTGVVSLATWPTCVLFDAGTPDGGSFRTWAPIITTPAVTLVKADDIPPGFTARRPVVYFGTGGDDRAPGDLMYRFYAVRDTRECSHGSQPVYSGAKTSADIFSSSNNPKRTEWIVGDNRDLSNNPLSGTLIGAEGSVGQRYWSDPVIFDDSIVFFASLPGSIESVNPCNNLSAGSSLLYGYAIRDFSLADGTRLSSGNSSIRLGGQTAQFLRSASKIRRSILVGQEVATAGVAQPSSSTTSTANTTPGDKLFVQTFDGEIRAFDEPVVSNSNTIRVLRWREIPLK